MISVLIIILLLSFFQHLTFSIISRARNRDNVPYHIVAAIVSNIVWFVTFQQLVHHQMTFVLFIPYCIGSTLGSLIGTSVSMKIEKLVGAKFGK